MRTCVRRWSTAWGSRLTSPYPWSSSTPVNKPSSKRSAPPDFSWPPMKAPLAPASKCTIINEVSCSETFHCCAPPFSYKPFSLRLCLKRPTRTQPEPVGAQPAHPPVHRQPTSTKRHFCHHAHRPSPHSKTPPSPWHGLYLIPVPVTQTLHQEHIWRWPAGWRKQWR